MSAFASAMAALHADTNMGADAQFRRPPLAWVPVRILLSQPTETFGTARAGTVHADVLVSALTDTPQRGDELRVLTTTYAVEAAERDALGLSWRLTLADRN